MVFKELSIWWIAILSHWVILFAEQKTNWLYWKLKIVDFNGGGIGIGCVERFTGGYDLYVGVIIAAISIFAFAIKNDSYTLGHSLEFIGENLTLNMYLIHPLILQLLYCYEDIFKVRGMVYEWCRPVIVIIVTLTLSKIIYILQRKVINNVRKKLWFVKSR